jgi:hypothetical protein
MQNKPFYLDQMLGVKWSLTLLIFAVFVVFIDFFISLVFHLNFLPEDKITFVAYIMRLLSIVFAFSALRFLYYKINDTINDLVKGCTEKGGLYKCLTLLKAQTSFLNKPGHHMLAGILANTIYMVILYNYVFPFLKWKPYHVFSNAIWVGILGVGSYIFVYGVQFSIKFSNTLNFHEVVDIYHQDRMGGLGCISKLLVDIVLLSGLAVGLWIGSIPYAFEHHFLLLIFCLGLLMEIFAVGHVFYQVNLVLNRIKREKIQECFQIYREARCKYEKSQSLKAKVDLLTKLSFAGLDLTEVNKLRLLPINYKDMLEFLGVLAGFLPIILQYLLTM